MKSSFQSNFINYPFKVIFNYYFIYPMRSSKIYEHFCSKFNKKKKKLFCPKYLQPCRFLSRVKIYVKRKQIEKNNGNACWFLTFYLLFGRVLRNMSVIFDFVNMDVLHADCHTRTVNKRSHQGPSSKDVEQEAGSLLS